MRDRRKTVADGLDHYLVQLYAKGGLVGEAGDRGRVLRGGDVQILDLTQSNVTQAAPRAPSPSSCRARRSTRRCRRRATCTA